MKNEQDVQEEKVLTEEQEEEKVNWVKEILGMVLYIAFLIFAVWFAVTFIGQRTEVSGDSMYDTLEHKDNLWIDKLSYRFKDPERYDIVVFPHQEPYKDEEVYYIKRIIGMPGETVQIDMEGNIYIDGEILEEEYGYETIEPYMIGRASEEIVLGDDEYFVMGDNRNDSKDSRSEEVGNIHRDEFEGKAVFRLWPFSKFGKIE